MPDLYQQDLAALGKALDTVLTPDAIQKHVMKYHDKDLVNTLIGSATAGIGPNDTPYPDYEESYKKAIGLVQRKGNKKSAWSRKGAALFLATGKGGKRRLHKAIAAGNKRWLRGVDHPGRSGGMLDPQNFSMEQEAGKLWLVWTPSDERMAIYGPVHQEGLPLGRNGPRKKRTWMHLDNVRNAKAVVKALEQTLDELAAIFNAGVMPR